MGAIVSMSAAATLYGDSARGEGRVHLACFRVLYYTTFLWGSEMNRTACDERELVEYNMSGPVEN